MKTLDLKMLDYAREGNEKELRSVLAEGADPMYMGGAVARVAAQAGWINCLELVGEEYGVPIGDTELIMGALGKHYPVVEYALFKGADPHAKNDMCYEIANQRGDDTLLQYLREAEK